MQRIARRFLIPLAIILLAAALGTFVLGRTRVQASSPTLENPGMLLTSNTKQSLSSEIAAGSVLFAEACSTCHGGDAQGGGSSATGTQAPKLKGLSGAEIDLWLEAGWMPLKTPETQPEIKPRPYTTQQILDIVAFVDSTSGKPPANLGLPTVDLKGASQSTGFDVFSLNCAPCHTITGSGDALGYGVHAPPLHDVTAQMVLEAIRTGPQNMPNFGPNDITPQQAQDIADFITKDIQHPANIGGIGLGGVGPVAEGFVGLFVGVGVCLVAAYWVGDRTDPDAYGEGDGEGHGEHDEHEPEAAEPDDAVGESSDEIVATDTES